MKKNNYIIMAATATILTGCSTYKTVDGNVETLSCQSGYVKHLKYNVIEVNNFKTDKHKTAFLISTVNNIDECNGYPCRTCTLFLCKNPHFDIVTYYSDDKKEFTSLPMPQYVPSNSNYDYLKKSSKMEFVEVNHKANYLWNIFVQNDEEHEQLFNKKTGNLIYEMITPVRVNVNTYVNDCDVNAYSIFDGFYSH